MSEQELDYAAIRGSVEKGVARQRWRYRLIFFMMHLLFFVGSMLVVWGSIAMDGRIRALLFESGSAAAIIVLAPTAAWSLMILSHIAMLYIESNLGEKAIRQQILMNEVGEEILRRGQAGVEKPKRQAAETDGNPRLSSYDGELDFDEAQSNPAQERTARRAGDA